MTPQILSASVQQLPLEPVSMMVALGCASGLGLIAAAVSMWTRSHRPGTIGAGHLVLLAPLIALIMLFIGSNLALSVGMVGALSIVRFRTAIKSAWDMMYLLWAVAIGLGCGTGNWWIATIGSIVIAVIAVIVALVSKRHRPDGEDKLLQLNAVWSTDSITGKLEALEKISGIERLISIQVNGENIDCLARLKSDASQVLVLEQILKFTGITKAHLMDSITQ